MPIKILKIDDFWIKVKDGKDEAEVLVKPVHYNTYREAIRAVSSVAEEERWLRFCEVIAPKIVIDWKGVQDDSGKNIPFAIDMAVSGFSDRIWSQIIKAALKEINAAEESFRRDSKPVKVAKGKSRRVRRSDS